MADRLLFIAMNLNSGGAERQMVTIASALKKKGYEISFVCYDQGDFFCEYLESVGISVNWIIKKKAISRLLTIRKFIRNGNYDVVISFLETANILNLFAGIGGKRWKIITGERSSRVENLASIRGHIVAFLQKKTDKLVCNSWNALNLWKRYYPNLKDKLTVIYNCINIDAGSFNIQSKSDLLKTRIVIAASYRTEKNPINLINAVGLLSDDYKSRLCIDWYGGYDFPENIYSECQKRIIELGLAQSINLYGPSKEIHKSMLEADYVALFSKYEGLPNAICEGMMLEKPIIMTKVSDFKVLVDGNGLLCVGDSPLDIKNALEEAIDTDSEERKEMGERSKEIADLLFSEQTVISYWQKLIDTI